MTVGRRLGDELRADRARGAGAVLDHDRLAQGLVQPLAQRARHYVGCAAGGEGHDEADRPVRIARLCGDERRRREARKRDQRLQKFAGHRRCSLRGISFVKYIYPVE